MSEWNEHANRLATGTSQLPDLPSGQVLVCLVCEVPEFNYNTLPGLLLGLHRSLYVLYVKCLSLIITRYQICYRDFAGACMSCM